MILDKFVENNFSKNCRQILGECSEYFCHIINSLLNGLLVLYREILSSRFYALTSQARSLLQHLELRISRHGLRIVFTLKGLGGGGGGHFDPCELKNQRS